MNTQRGMKGKPEMIRLLACVVSVIALSAPGPAAGKPEGIKELPGGITVDRAARTVTVAGAIAFREGPLEFSACRRGTKEKNGNQFMFTHDQNFLFGFRCICLAPRVHRWQLVSLRDFTVLIYPLSMQYPPSRPLLWHIFHLNAISV